MDKPVNISIKEQIIRTMSTNMMVSERIITLVVNHQFESAHKALLQSNSLEFSGWGKFYFNKKKAGRKIINYQRIKAFYIKELERDDLTEKEIRTLNRKLQSVDKEINSLMVHINED